MVKVFNKGASIKVDGFTLSIELIVKNKLAGQDGEWLKKVIIYLEHAWLIERQSQL